ncbi:MAG: L-seryl-tRNA(Sec) selenium transferase [Firmicutes bacterium]|nr:L-seryl-tRNA(Sec) selenium transferase [Dethiobacter sp.]MBS3887980.1 L-seryl-tRNA(Sec) selenium transferase [Bacillota bacterium]
MNTQRLREIPQVDEVLRRGEFAELVATYGRVGVREAVQNALEEMRGAILAEEAAALATPQPHTGLLARVQTILGEKRQMSLRRVINCTGLPLHTNLGRAPLAEEAIAAVVMAAKGYSTLEYELDTGERGSRQSHVRALLCELTGAEDALVVNNNAGAVLLVLSALAKEREVVVSRGELVEIGGAFRIPEVILQGGARLREVGTTNKTYARDYERAITEQTAALLKVHTSNFLVTGFTATASRAELVALAKTHHVLAIEDLGSGTMLPLWGEPTVQEAVSSGLDVITFSGDKLLGGPQAGIIVGKKHLIELIARHPLARALRIDKLTLAALEATLRLYRHGDYLERVPLLSMLRMPVDELREKAEALAAQIGNLRGMQVQVMASSGQVGGGSLPGQELLGWAVAILSPLGCMELLHKLRQRAVPIIARLEKGRVLLDLRCVLPGEKEEIVEALASLAAEVPA